MGELTPGDTFRQQIIGLQRRERVPSMAGAVAADGHVAFSDAVGLADIEGDVPAGPDTLYRIASITKTFTAAVVLLLADDGALGVDDKVEQYLPGTPLGAATLRWLLSHSAGVQREPVTPMWQTFEGPTEAELVETLPASRLVSRAGERWHYSNLGYAVLGQVVQRATGMPCEELIEQRLFGPLGLGRTTWQAKDPAAVGYYVEPYQDVVHREPDMQQRAAGVGGQLWSTTSDLLTWARALLGHRPEVLPVDVVDAMHRLHVMVDPQSWTRGWGLGLALERHGTRVFAGHTGSIPGFTSALLIHRPTGVAAVVLANASGASSVADLAVSYAETAIDHVQDSGGELWRPSEPCPDEVRDLLGPWWSEYGLTVFTWRDGHLHAHLTAAPSTSGSVFERESADTYRVTGGREYGERLHVRRSDDGRVTSLEWATYPYSREPR